MMRRALAIAALAASLGGAALAAAPAGALVFSPRVTVMVTGRYRVLHAPVSVLARPATVYAGRRCVVSQGTALAALAATHVFRGFHLVDYGSCSLRPLDASGLFVNRIGTDYNAGRNGWVYKVDTRSATNGAADLSGPFGRGRLRTGQRVTWFYCYMQPTGSCQRTLSVLVAAPRFAPGAPVPVAVRGYDDLGRSVAVAGAFVSIAGAGALTAADGTATLTAPATAGRPLISAVHAGMVPAFPVAVTVG
jgi:hypothetical protein